MPISIITKEIIKTWQKKRNIQDMALVRLPMANIQVSWLMAFAKAMACFYYFFCYYRDRHFAISISFFTSSC